MSFDISDPRLKNFLSEQDGTNLEEVKDIERNRKNYIVFNEGTAKLTFIGVSVREKSFDKNQLEKVVDTEISELN